MRPKAVNHGDGEIAKCWKTIRQSAAPRGLNRVSRLSPESNSGGTRIVGAQTKAGECLAGICLGRTTIWAGQNRPDTG
jgi:hypothetical protein